MKTGEAYWNSREQRALDLVITGPTQPLLFIARAALHRSAGDSEFNPVYTQKRVGRGGEQNKIFEIEKLRTLGPDHKPLNKLAAKFRKLGIDELAQLANVRRGEMSVFGWRPLVPTSDHGVTSFEEIMDSLSPRLQTRWQNVTIATNPGILSSYGLYQHIYAKDHVMRAEMDIQDAMNASLSSSIALLGSFVTAAVNRKLQ